MMDDRGMGQVGTALCMAVLTVGGAHVAFAEPSGNLRVDVHCADYWATPERGLAVTIDGRPERASATNGTTLAAVAIDANGLASGPYTTWEPTDVGFEVTPGAHRLTVEAPGCRSVERDIWVDAQGPSFVSGRLPIDDASLAGTVGAPDGLGLSLGAWRQRLPMPPTSALMTRYEYDDASMIGGSFTFSYERRYFAFAVDTAIGRAQLHGVATYVGANPGVFSDTSSTFTGSVFESRLALRAGVRAPLRSVALAAGSGLGGSVRMTSATLDHAATRAMPPDDVAPSWFVPLWAALTLKPACDWGAQVLAQYEVHPTSAADNHSIVGAALVWQPSRACSESPRLVVSRSRAR